MFEKLTSQPKDNITSLIYQVRALESKNQHFEITDGCRNTKNNSYDGAVL